MNNKFGLKTEGILDALFYIEELKFGNDFKTESLAVSYETHEDLIKKLVKDSGLNLNPEDLCEDIYKLGRSYSRLFELDEMKGRSIFDDGVLLGIALAKGLSPGTIMDVDRIIEKIREIDGPQSTS